MSVAGPLEIVASLGAILGEGPVWDEAAKQLLWVDIGSSCVHSFDPASGRTHVWRFDSSVSAICPTGDGRYVAATGIGVAELSFSTGALEPLIPLPNGERMNDAKADPGGRLLGGTYMSQRQPDACGLYRFDLAGACLLAAGTVPNGLGWSPDGSQLYFADSPKRRIDVFDYQVASGEVGSRRVFVDLADAPGNPDGLTVDEDGYVWVAIVRGGFVFRFDPSGRKVEAISVPVDFVTSCAFGGPELNDLYITSGSVESECGTYSHALGGALFRVETSVRGLPVTPCRLLDELTTSAGTNPRGNS